MLRKSFVAVQSGQNGKLFQHVVKKKRQPDAFAFSFFADEIHTVVPIAAAHQRQTVFAEFQAIFDRAHAVFVKRAGLGRAVRQIVIRFLFRRKRTTF